MKWIKLTDEHPKHNHCSFIITDGTIVGVGYWDVNEFMCVDMDDFVNEITHWMPFPKLPLEEKENT